MDDFKLKSLLIEHRDIQVCLEILKETNEPVDILNKKNRLIIEKFVDALNLPRDLKEDDVVGAVEDFLIKID